MSPPSMIGTLWFVLNCSPEGCGVPNHHLRFSDVLGF